MDEIGMTKSDRIAALAYLNKSKADIIDALVERRENPGRRSAVTHSVMVELAVEYADGWSKTELERMCKRQLAKIIADDVDGLELEPGQNHLTKNQLCQIAAEYEVFIDDND
jgi:hypothetical protein